MNIGLEFTKTEKFVNGPATIVKMEAKVDLSKIRAFSVIRNIPFVEQVLNEIEADYYDGMLVLTGKGVSRCQATDEYNEKVGYYIAQSRASYEIMKKYNKFLDDVIMMIDKLFYNDVSDLYCRTLDTMYKLQDHIELDLINR